MRKKKSDIVKIARVHVNNWWDWIFEYVRWTRHTHTYCGLHQIRQHRVHVEEWKNFQLFHSSCPQEVSRQWLRPPSVLHDDYLRVQYTRMKKAILDKIFCISVWFKRVQSDIWRACRPVLCQNCVSRSHFSVLSRRESTILDNKRLHRKLFLFLLHLFLQCNSRTCWVSKSKWK